MVHMISKIHCYNMGLSEHTVVYPYVPLTSLVKHHYPIAETTI